MLASFVEPIICKPCGQNPVFKNHAIPTLTHRRPFATMGREVQNMAPPATYRRLKEHRKNGTHNPHRPRIAGAV